MDKKIEQYVITVVLYFIGVSVGQWVVVAPSASLLQRILCAVGGGILFTGCIGFYALRIHSRVKGQYEAFFLLFTFMYALGWVSVVVAGAMDFPDKTSLLFTAIVVGMMSVFYVGVYSVWMQNVRPSVPYLLNSRVYPPQSTFSVSLCERVAPFMGCVKVCTTISVYHTSVSMVNLLVQVSVPDDAIPHEGVSLQTLQEEAKQSLRDSVKLIFAGEALRGDRHVYDIKRDLKETLADWGACVEDVTFVEKALPQSSRHDLAVTCVA